jgi:hypothetical protein
VSKESRRATRNAARTGQGAPGSTGPSGSPRAGRRERVRRIEQKSFFDRYRSLILGAVIIAVGAVVIGLVITQTTAAAYTCSIEWEPTPTASPAAGASPRLGYAQDDMGRSHDVKRPQKYTLCPPASGNHHVQPLAPIVPRLYRPDDSVGPTLWIHNLEHGGLVVLYRGDGPGATADGQVAFKTFFDAFPPSPICQVPAGKVSPVIARFDQMKWPYAALVWGRVLPLDEWDPAQVLQFYATESERLDAAGAFATPPEPPCAAPSQSAPPSEPVAPSSEASASPAASSSPASSGSPAAPGSTAPSASPEPSPAAS